MFDGPIPPGLRDKLELAVVAARIVLTAGVAVLAGEAIAALVSASWAGTSFAITASTVSLLGWPASGRIVPARK